MRDAGADAADGGYLWRSMCILWMTSLSSHSTSALVSGLSRLVTHTTVSSPKCNSEKRPLSNSVAFQTLFKWHRYCGILKIHIVRKINTGIRYEPVYRPALYSPSCRSKSIRTLFIFRTQMKIFSMKSQSFRTLHRIVFFFVHKLFL